MAVKEEIVAFADEMRAWRRDIHAHPEIAFDEVRTSDIVAEKLESFGIDVHRGLAKTGVVGTLAVGNSNRAIGLRADLDALDIHEENTFGHMDKSWQDACLRPRRAYGHVAGGCEVSIRDAPV